MTSGLAVEQQRQTSSGTDSRICRLVAVGRVVIASDPVSAFSRADVAQASFPPHSFPRLRKSGTKCQPHPYICRTYAEPSSRHPHAWGYSRRFAPDPHGHRTAPGIALMSNGKLQSDAATARAASTTTPANSLDPIRPSFTVRPPRHQLRAVRERDVLDLQPRVDPRSGRSPARAMQRSRRSKRSPTSTSPPNPYRRRPDLPVDRARSSRRLAR
jgi:hypothetical protein